MRKNLIETSHHQTFESLKKEGAEGEFWSAREFSKILDYNDYRKIKRLSSKITFC